MLAGDDNGVLDLWPSIEILRAEKTVAPDRLQLWGFSGNGVLTDSVQEAVENKSARTYPTDESRGAAEDAEKFRATCG